MFDLASSGGGKMASEGQRGQASTAAAEGAGHGSRPLYRWAQLRAQVGKGYASCEAHGSQRAVDVSNFSQKSGKRTRPHGDDQKPGLGEGTMQILLDADAIKLLQSAQLWRMAIVNQNRLAVFRQTQSSEQGSGNASAAEKNSSLHASSAQAWSAARTSASISASLCAVEMIQCRPFEGVM